MEEPDIKEAIQDDDGTADLSTTESDGKHVCLQLLLNSWIVHNVQLTVVNEYICDIQYKDCSS